MAMKIGVLGTGVVGTTHATRLVGLGHEVMMGSRTSDNPEAVSWAAATGGRAAHGTFAEAAAFGALLINATLGVASEAALRAAGAEHMRGKVLIDISNPLDFSHGMPPSLSVCNTDSMGERLQGAFPDVRVVKALNTMNCAVQVDPQKVPGAHVVFLCGNDPSAKSETVGLLHSYGWTDDAILDLGDISAARGVEMILPLWVRLMGVLGHADFNFGVVR
jgi:8-hydroxy-5-deazaflavin:NADPH oxidoreductase